MTEFSVLIDTNVLLRALQPRNIQYGLAINTLEHLRRTGRELHLVPQILVELWVVATRPVVRNGLGMSPIAAAKEIDLIKKPFRILPEVPEIYPVWESLVRQYAISGKPAHDARLVAAMLLHGLTSIITFDQSGFSRFPFIEVVHPGAPASEA